MNKIFFASDLHFNHKNVIEYCNRPYSNVENMNEGIIKKWNSVVGKDDVVWCLGDLGFGNKKIIKEFVTELNGKKRLIMGNHDNFPIKVYLDMGFEIVSPFPIIWNNIYILSHYPMRKIPQGYINLYGHVHTDDRFPTFCKNAVCCCIDRFDLRPKEFRELICEYKNEHNKYCELSYYIEQCDGDI